MKIPAIIINTINWLTSNSAVKFVITVIASGGLATFWVETNTRTEMRVQIEKEIVTGQVRVYNYFKSIEDLYKLKKVEGVIVASEKVKIDQHGNQIDKTTSELETYFSEEIIYTPTFSVNERDNQRQLSLIRKIESELDNLDHEAYVRVVDFLDFIDQYPINDLSKSSGINSPWTNKDIQLQYLNKVKELNAFFEERYGKFQSKK